MSPMQRPTEPVALPVREEPTPIRDWHVVECPVCGKVREEAKPGSEIKWRCPRCKNDVTAKIAA